MRTPTLCRSAVLVLACLLLAGPLAAVPSKYVRQQAVNAADKLEAQAANTLSKAAALKAANEWDAVNDDGDINSYAVGRRLRQFFNDVWDKYYEAIAEGWTDADPDLTKARATIDAARAKFEAAGMWTPCRFGEAFYSSRYRNLLESPVDRMWGAVASAKKGKIDDAKDDFERIEGRLKAIPKELANASPMSHDDVVLAPDHPAVARMVAEVARVKALAAGNVGAADAAIAAIDADVEGLIKALENSEAVFRVAAALPTTSGSEEQRQESYVKGLALIEAWEKDQRDAVTKVFDAFGAKYGTESMALNNKINNLLGKGSNYRRDPGAAYEAVATGLKDVRAARVDTAARLLREVTEVTDRMKEYHEFSRLSRYDDVQPKLEMAVKLDPDNAAAKAKLAALPAERAATAAAIDAAIDKRTFGGNVATFQGPGNPAALAKSALAYIRANTEFDTLAMRVVGDWFVFDRDVLGRPLHYGVPVEVVQIRPMDKAAGPNRAVVFELSMLTLAQSATPNWSGSAVAGSWWIRASKVTRQ